jgi:ribonucleoside-diphosphate reductase alpha chain
MIKIELINEEVDVYDFTIENTHNFYANDILVHNCCEIFEVSSPEETAVCNLASISLPSFIDNKNGRKSFNFSRLIETSKTLTENLNKIIDNEYYPVESAKKSNNRHRPIGIGVQGLADVFAQMRYSWESEEAKKLNKDIFESIYYGFLCKSNELSEKLGSYETFAGSPASEGMLQFDLWGVEESNRYDWGSLKEKIKQSGLRNSLGLAPMPTASTSQIMGNTECFEPITSNIYKRATLSGEFIQLNKYLVDDLIELGLWNDQIRQKIIAAEGSIQNIDEIPSDLKKLYKTVWEMSQKVLIDMSADRAPFICQSQSLNLYFKDANFAKLTSAYFYGWEKGLKTIVYYTRTQNKSAQKFTVEYNIEKELKEKAKQKEVETEELSCSLDNPDACLSCGS